MSQVVNKVGKFCACTLLALLFYSESLCLCYLNFQYVNPPLNIVSKLIMLSSLLETHINNCIKCWIRHPTVLNLH